MCTYEFETNCFRQNFHDSTWCSTHGALFASFKQPHAKFWFSQLMPNCCQFWRSSTQGSETSEPTLEPDNLRLCSLSALDHSPRREETIENQSCIHHSCQWTENVWAYSVRLFFVQTRCSSGKFRGSRSRTKWSVGLAYLLTSKTNHRSSRMHPQGRGLRQRKILRKATDISRDLWTSAPGITFFLPKFY